MSGQGLSAEEREALAGDVWQEADGVLLLCVVPGEWWQDFRGDRVPWNAPTIARPLRPLLDPQGNLVAARLAQVTAERDAAEAKVAAVRALAQRARGEANFYAYTGSPSIALRALADDLDALAALDSPGDAQGGGV